MVELDSLRESLVAGEIDRATFLRKALGLGLSLSAAGALVAAWGRSSAFAATAASPKRGGTLVFATAFHEWVAVEADEEGTGWIRGLIEHARERGVEVASYADYWERTTARDRP